MNGDRANHPNVSTFHDGEAARQPARLTLKPFQESYVPWSTLSEKPTRKRGQGVSDEQHTRQEGELLERNALKTYAVDVAAGVTILGVAGTAKLVKAQVVENLKSLKGDDSAKDE
jgi:hypothetical protein